MTGIQGFHERPPQARMAAAHAHMDALQRQIDDLNDRVDRIPRILLPAPEPLIEGALPLRRQEWAHPAGGEWIRMDQPQQETPTLWQRICAVVERCFIAVFDFICTYLCCPPRAQVPVEPAAPQPRPLED